MGIWASFSEEWRLIWRTLLYRLLSFLYLGMLSYSTVIFCDWIRDLILPYLEAKLAYYCCMGAVKMYAIPRSETKDFTLNSTASSISISQCILVPLGPTGTTQYSPDECCACTRFSSKLRMMDLEASTPFISSTVGPPCLQVLCSKAPGGSLKLWVVPHPIDNMFFPINTYAHAYIHMFDNI